jgi:fibronectin-binding autotransporter adhesin
MKVAFLMASVILLLPASSMAGFSIDDVSVTEGNSGVKHLAFTVTLDACLTSYCSVTVSTVDDSAWAGSDYIESIFMIASLSSSVPQQWQFTVPVLTDTMVELNERLIAILTTPVGAVINDAGGYGNILNDDSAQISIQDPPARLEDYDGPPMAFEVVLHGDVDRQFDIDYTTLDGSASVADGDYAASTGKLTFLLAHVSRRFFVGVSPDDRVELDESFSISLGNIQAHGRDVTCLDCTAVGTILNDDSATISIDDVTAAEGDSGPSIFSFDVSLDQEVDIGVDVDFNTADGTATVDNDDYESTFGTLMFDGSAGEVKTLNVTVNGDTDPGPDETFFVNLSNVFASGRDVTLANSQGQGTILTDDNVIFSNGFESGGTTLWSNTVP